MIKLTKLELKQVHIKILYRDLIKQKRNNCGLKHQEDLSGCFQSGSS
jgi:hypothetical protein